MTEQNAESIFGQAIEIQSEEDRAAFLNRACGENQQLRADVEKLVADHFRAGSFLEQPAINGDATAAMPPGMEQVGSHIGPYKLRERLGEGGMGVVWAAEQKQPLRRKVALKVIKPGMDSSQVIARFEAEREALALMDHPNIARVLDAGTTDQGRPYFVMELIHGVPITEYCDMHRLTIVDRIMLFIQVCKAVQHAHVKGIIHRDIKPSNVLVSEQDGEPIPKVIDFGVAKALHHRLTDQSIYTGVFQAIGTLTYMSPEQASLSQHDVDTRADVYGLGIVLYELLTGTTPLDRDQLERGAFDEALRMIREKHPQKPSTKISSLGDNSDLVSQCRCTNPQDLQKLVQGDLDWIVMTALEKDRKQRYQTASQLGDELTRYLNDQPVEARPPSTIYRVRKYIQRNKGFVAAISSIGILLLAGVIGLSGITAWALEQKRVAKETLGDLLEAYKREAAMSALAGDADAAQASLDVIEQISPIDHQYQAPLIHGLLKFNRGDYREAGRLVRTASSAKGEQPASQRIAAKALLGLTHWHLGESQAFGRILAELQDSSPKTETDKLLLALALAMFEPRRSEKLLQGAPRAEQSAIGLRIRGVVRSLVGRDTKDVGRLEQAIRDFDCSRLLNNDESVALGMQLLTLSAAAELARSEGRDEDAAHYLRVGRPLARVAEPDNTATHEGRWAFFRADGQTQNAEHAIRQLGRFPGYFCMLLAADCLERIDSSNALVEFDNAVEAEYRHTTPVLLARAHLLTDGDAQADAKQRLIAELEQNESSFVGLLALCALCRLSDADQVHSVAREYASKVHQVPQPRLTLFNNEDGIELLAGGDPEELLRKTKNSNLAKSQVYFTIGMLRLAEGDRDQALQHFALAVETCAVGTYGYEWARAYHARMKRDPTWPRLHRDVN